ncbi:hypothetical protein JNUCC0626_43755 [Lentzea sp. JNUCC 0626]|uniref:hypothetical protein n=1 Tax=Lentzea sp. JNUCC 0626 TaxID=3367513 RepID=UPI0037497369
MDHLDHQHQTEHRRQLDAQQRTIVFEREQRAVEHPATAEEDHATPSGDEPRGPTTPAGTNDDHRTFFFRLAVQPAEPATAAHLQEPGLTGALPRQAERKAG